MTLPPPSKPFPPHKPFVDLVKQASELEMEAYPLLDELTSKISTSNLERVRRLKSRLLALTRRVQKVRDEIEQLMDDDGDMAEMYLTEKKRLMELQFDVEQSLSGFRSMDGGQSVSAPVSPVSSPPDSRRLDKSFSLAKSRHDGAMSSESANDNIEELEMLLEAYFVVIDSTLNKLTSLKEYIEDTEDFINIQLDTVRNQLIQFELLLTTATFVVATFGVVAAFFANLFAMEDIFVGSVNVSPKVKCPNIPIDEEIDELDDNIRVFGGTTHTVLLNTMQNRNLLDVQSVPHGLTAGSCSGLTFYNYFADMTKNLNTKAAVKTYTAKSSTVMKPTASQLAKQNPRSQVRVGGSR